MANPCSNANYAGFLASDYSVAGNTLTKIVSNGNATTPLCNCLSPTQNFPADALSSRLVWVVTYNQITHPAGIWMSNSSSGGQLLIKLLADGSFTIVNNVGTVVASFPANTVVQGDVLQWDADPVNHTLMLNNVMIYTESSTAGGGAFTTSAQFSNFTILIFTAGDTLSNVVKTTNCTIPVVAVTSDPEVKVNLLSVVDNINLTLATPTECQPNSYYFKKLVSDTNVVTITPQTGTIDGQASVSFDEPFGAVQVFFDGTNWHTLSNYN